MKVITESFLRASFKKKIPETFQVGQGQILTPSAVQFLNEKRVQVLTGRHGKLSATTDGGSQKKYVSAIDGTVYRSKPEHMTHLSGNRLILKDHPRIIFRGKLDSFQSEILLLQSRADGDESLKVVEELGELLDRARQIMRADVRNEPLPQHGCLGLSDAELRERSHNPKKYFGVGHLILFCGMDALVLQLNRLRTLVREVEISAVTAFRSESHIERADIIQTLNRMSSAIYIMMLKVESGEYRKRD